MATRVDLGSVIGPQGPAGPAPTFSRVYKGLDAVSVPNGGNPTLLGSITFPAGTYIVTFFATFAANATGTRFIVFNTSTSKGRDCTVTGQAVNSGATILNGTRLLTLSAATTYNLYAYQNSGSANSVSGGWSYIKLS